MQKFRPIFYSILLVAVVAVFVFRQQVFDYFGPQLRNLEKAATKLAIKEISKNISAPTPLRSNKPIAVPLTRSGTTRWTNVQRSDNGLPSLSENTQLDSIALLRLEDMFKNQYFAHVSPTGSKAELVAENVRYDFLALGENLALGNFDGDKDLVQAWMNSPGHRANILNTHYTEIGVAVKAGIYEGRPTWVGVQIFGRPASDCPKPDAGLKVRIESTEAQLKDLAATIAEKKAEIENSNRHGRDYNTQVAAYNALVEQYNALLAQLKDFVGEYNAQVSALNQCIGS